MTLFAKHFITVQGAIFFGFLIFLCMSILVKKSPIKTVLVNFCVFFFLIGIVEILCWASIKSSPFEKSYAQGYRTKDEILGYAPKKAIKTASRAYYNGNLIYDVIYTINEDGLRVTPDYNLNPHETPIIFFGCSYTFGEGVKDNEATPYLVGEYSKRKVYNFSFHGYGPHQMFAALEKGIVERIVPSKKIIVIYPTMLVHVSRAAGFSFWDKHGPRYKISSDGELYYAGHFDDEINPLKDFLVKAYIYKFFNNNSLKLSVPAVNLYLKLIEASNNFVKEKFPGSEFHVILWPVLSKKENIYYDMIKNGLKERNIKTHYITDIIVNYENNRQQYMISNNETHPNALAHKIVADYVVREIIGKKLLNSHE